MHSKAISSSNEPEYVFELKEELCPIDEGIAKTSLAGTSLVLLSISALAAAGLLLPHTSFGMAMLHLTYGGLIATSVTAGVIAFALLTTILILHIRNARFFASEVHPIGDENNKGFLYKIKNKDGETLGYLLGSCHAMARDWPGLNDRIMSKFNKSETAFFEAHIPPLMGFSCWLMGMKVGADTILQKLARKTGKEIWVFESLRTQQLRGVEVANFENTHARKKTKEEAPQLNDTQIWRSGDPQNVIDDWKDIVNGLDEKGEKEFNEILLGRANEIYVKYTQQALEERASREKKIFVVVGEAHLFDFPGTKGLITSLTENGWTIENAYPDSVESASSSSID